MTSGEELNIAKFLSNLAGYGITVASVLYKVPQIINILSAHSAEGLSLNSFIIETFGFTVSLAYSHRNGYPFSTYGETISILFQNLIVLLLIIYYTKHMIQCVLAVVVFIAWIYYILFVSSMDLVTLLQSSSVLILIFSKVPQILTLLRFKSSGTLAIPTYLMGAAGSFIKIITSLVLTPDINILIGYILSTLLNSIILVLIVFYRYVSPPSKDEKTIDTKNEKTASSASTTKKTKKTKKTD